MTNPTDFSVPAAVLAILLAVADIVLATKKRRRARA